MIRQIFFTIFIFHFFSGYSQKEKTLEECTPLSKYSRGIDSIAFKTIEQWDSVVCWRCADKGIHRNEGCGFMQCDGWSMSLGFHVDESGKPVNIKWSIHICYHRPLKLGMKRRLTRSFNNIIFPKETRGKCYTAHFGAILKC